jgi:hypothetical protein
VAVHRVGAGEDDLVEGLGQLLEDDLLRRRVTDAAREHCADHSWSRIASRHVDLWNSMEPV